MRLRHLVLAGVAASLATPALTPSALAGEGMWTPFQLPEIAPQLKAAGLQLSPKTLANLKAPPLSAVSWLGNCTASFVSNQGLTVTNHHCAYGSIQFNSTKERDLIKQGFVAQTLADELPAAPGSRIMVLEDLRDVTADVIGGLPDDMNPRVRFQAIEDKIKALVQTCESQKGRRCDVRPYYGGKQYVLQQMLEIQDVRLVYAPAEGIGFFGGDVDNWMWPRHTGDFSFYRAYVGKDGAPAPYSKDNVPFRPKAWLRLAREGVKDGDFVMVAGYPGATNRWRTLSETRFWFNELYPRQVEFVNDRISTITEATADDREAQIKYANTLAGLNNTEKNFRGQLDGAKNIDLIGRKTNERQALDAWINADPARQARFAPALQQLEALIAEENDARLTSVYVDPIVNQVQMISTARRLYRWAKEQEKPDQLREPGFQERDRSRFIASLEQLDRRYDPAVDGMEFLRTIGLHQQVEPAKRWQAIEKLLAGQTQGQVVKGLYDQTKLGDSKARTAWMEKKPAEFEASDDPFIKLAVALYSEDIAREEAVKTRAGRFQRLRPLYMEAMIAFAQSQGRAIYPDANATLRVSFGKVTGRTLKGGKAQPSLTFLNEIAPKATGEFPFAAPQRQLDLIKAGKTAPYKPKGMADLPVNTLSTLDITGGNSGSPVMNARGELVGLAFDGTIEGIISDWAFDEALSRTITVDHRYMLWVMDYVDGAHRLLREMGVRPAARK
jgi:hypothetical protein